MARRIRPVAWIHNNLGFGGGERVLVEQVRALAARGNPVDVWTIEAEGPQDLIPDIRAANPNVRDIESVRSAGTLARILRQRSYEAVLTCWSVRGYRALERLARVPFARRPVCIETVHERYGWCLRDHRDRRRRQADYWLAMYDFVDEVRAAFALPSDRVAITRPLFPALLPRGDPALAPARERGRALRRSLGIPDDALVVGYVGRLSGNKGLHHVVPLVGRLRARGVDVHLVLAGRLSPPSIEYGARWDAVVAAARARGSPLEGRLHLVGAVEDGSAIYGASDVVPLLSFMEGFFPLMLVEAMALGVAVVTTDVGGIGTVLTDDVNACVVRKIPDDEAEPTDDVIEAFATALESLLADPAKRRRIAEAGRRHVERLVAEADFHAATLAAYERALALGRLRR